MSACPPVVQIQRLLNDELPAAESGLLEVHLENCARCRQKLDLLAGLSTISEAASSARGLARKESASLLLAMENLQREPEKFGEPPTPPPFARVQLEPTTRDGFLGKLGGIDIRRVIGRGGMGIVYEGVDPALNRTVAVKVLSPHLLGDAAAKERFVREAQAVAALTHTNVVAIHAIAETDGVPYLVLQFVSGESLAEVLAREKKLPAEEMARIGAQIARGLAAAHAVGLVHLHRGGHPLPSSRGCQQTGDGSPARSHRQRDGDGAAFGGGSGCWPLEPDLLARSASKDRGGQ